MPDTDIDLALDEPTTVATPTGPARQSVTGPSLGRVIFTILALFTIAGLFGGFLGAISGDLL